MTTLILPSATVDVSESTTPKRAVTLSAVAPAASSDLTPMDPRLQRILARRRLGKPKRADVSTDMDEVAVLARVTSVTQWESLSEVRVGSTIGESTDGTFVVTGRIPVQRIEAVRLQPFVASLKAAIPLRRMLDATLTDTEAAPHLLPPGERTSGGAGVVVGVVDYGCDFVHKNFRTAAGGTRLLSIWDQSGPPSPQSPFGYGRKYTREQIDRALQEPDPYASLGYEPPPDLPGGSKGTHGTHVLDIAAGNGHGSKLPGVASQADLIFVDVSHDDLAFSGPDVVQQCFGDSVRLLEALRFIFDEAGNRPCVINISLGTNGGPHDGTTLVEAGIDALIRARPNRAVVIAASNSFDDGIHATGSVAAAVSADLHWRIPTSDLSHNELEIWFGGTNRFAAELIGPDGQSLLTVEPGESDGLTGPGGDVLVFIANRLNDPNNNDNVIGVFLDAGLSGGAWKVRLHGRTVTDGLFHAWIERDDRSQSQFAPPHDNTHTIGSISCGGLTVVVGSYDAHKADTPLSWFSSAGPTRDGREKPEVSAPGHAVLAAHSRTKNGVVPKSGTSMAAPAVAGIIALVLAEAASRGISLTGQQIHDLVVKAAQGRPAGTGAGWDRRYGHGRLSAAKALQLLPAGAGAPSKPTSTPHGGPRLNTKKPGKRGTGPARKPKRAARRAKRG